MVPQQRQVRTRGRKRRSHDALTAPSVVTCPQCGAPKRPHSACTECGYVRPGLQLKSTGQED
ncbi:MAG: 50S ribosomal protein L32 [Planctomycetota bacterium]